MEPAVRPEATTETRTRFAYRFTRRSGFYLFKLLFGLKIEGKANLPGSEPFILVSNHKSWFDPPIIGCSCPRELFYAAKRELFSHLILGPIVRLLNAVPVARSGFDRKVILKLGEALEKGYGILIFPEGTRFLDDKLHPPRAGVGMLALRHTVPIVPTFISGSARIRRQFYRRQLRVRFGRPFSVEELGLEDATGRDKYRAVAAAVMQRIAEVGGLEPPEKVRTSTKGTKFAK